MAGRMMMSLESRRGGANRRPAVFVLSSTEGVE